MIIRVAVERLVGEHHSGITKSPVIAMIREVDTWDGAGRVGRDDRQIAAGQHRSFDGAHKRGLTHVGYQRDEITTISVYRCHAAEWVLLRVWQVGVVSDHFKADHRTHSHIRIAQRFRMHIASHLLRAKEWRFF